MSNLNDVMLFLIPFVAGVWFYTVKNILNPVSQTIKDIKAELKAELKDELDDDTNNLKSELFKLGGEDAKQNLIDGKDKNNLRRLYEKI